MGTTQSDAVVSAIILAVPLWLQQCLVKDFIRSVPEVVLVQTRKTAYLLQHYDILLDFELGTDIFKALGISEQDPFLNIDHNMLMVNKITDKFPLKHFITVSKIEYHDPSDEVNESKPKHELTLDRLYECELECSFCCTEIVGQFSTPCWNCRNAVCFDCVRAHFRSAMTDFERFPARCCDYAFHPDVAKGILPDQEHAKYRLRFEEWLTKAPIYCPVPTCSAFLPARMIQRGRDRASGFNCYACGASLCIDCKQYIHPNEKCSSHEHRTMEEMEKFGYKQCPKCGIAVAKLVGCSHVMCKCGAHWCWDCRRKIDECYQLPCDAFYGREDSALIRDNASDIDSLAESEIAEPSGEALNTEVNPRPSHTNVTFQSDAQGNMELSSRATGIVNGNHANVLSDSTTISGVTSTTANEFLQPPEMFENETKPDAMSQGTSMVDRNQVFYRTEDAVSSGSRTNTNLHNRSSQIIADMSEVHPTESKGDAIVNLDDPTHAPWEYENLDLGSEPIDKDTLDAWGCVHRFTPVTYTNIPRYWLTASIPDWWERDTNKREVNCMICWKAVRVAPKKSEVEVRDWRFARRCSKCNIIICRRCKNDLIKSDD